jgi:hypothetical protein
VPLSRSIVWLPSIQSLIWVMFLFSLSRLFKYILDRFLDRQKISRNDKERIDGSLTTLVCAWIFSLPYLYFSSCFLLLLFCWTKTSFVRYSEFLDLCNSWLGLLNFDYCYLIFITPLFNVLWDLNNIWGHFELIYWMRVWHMNMLWNWASCNPLGYGKSIFATMTINYL